MKINGKDFIIKRYSSGEMKLLKADFAAFFKEKLIDIFYNQEELSFFELYLFIQYFNDNHVKVNLTLTYLPYQRMNHDNEKEVSTLVFVKQFLQSLHLNHLKIVEPHTPIELNCEVEHVFLGETLLKTLFQKHPNLKSSQIFFTDKGGVLRNQNIVQNFLFGKKTRDALGFINSYEIVGNLKGKSVIIMDDIISSGDTICEAIQELEKLGANEFYIIATHFEKNIFNKRLFEKENVKQIITTNTLTKQSRNKKLMILPIWEVLNEQK